MTFEDSADKPGLKTLYFSNRHQGKLGKIGDQTFYTIRYEAGKSLALPFTARPFSVLLNLVTSLSKKHIKLLAQELLASGMACAICNGEQAEEASEIIDEVINTFDSSDDQYTPYSSSCEEGFDEALQYFALPTGLTNVSIIITVGDDHDHGSTIDSINSLGNAGYEYCLTADTEEENFEDLPELDIAALYYDDTEVDEYKYLREACHI